MFLQSLQTAVEAVGGVGGGLYGALAQAGPHRLPSFRQLLEALADGGSDPLVEVRVLIGAYGQFHSPYTDRGQQEDREGVSHHLVGRSIFFHGLSSKDL